MKEFAGKKFDVEQSILMSAYPYFRHPLQFVKLNLFSLHLLITLPDQIMTSKWFLYHDKISVQTALT